MSNTGHITSLPIVNVQHDFQNVIADVQDGLAPEDFWVSCYKTGSTSVHGKVRVTKEGGDVQLASRLGVEFTRGQRVRYILCFWPCAANQGQFCSSLYTPLLARHYLSLLRE